MENENIEILASLIVSITWTIPLACYFDCGYFAISIGCLGFLITRKLMF